jgi:hypothetical protein
MAQRYDSNSTIDDNDERERREQEEMTRQLAGGRAESEDDEMFPDPSSFTSGYAQRGGNSRGAMGRAASGASTGAAIGSMVPGIGNAVGAGVGALVGGIAGLANRRASTAPTDYAVDDARSIITDAFSTYNGHAPAAGEVDQIIRGQGWQPGDRFVGSGGLDSVLNNLRGNAVRARNEPPPVAAPVATEPTAAAPVDYTKRGKFGTFNAGAADKYDKPWEQLSERYKMQTVLSNFDPNAGITPEVIAALNAANINGATFSGSGDKLDARGLQNWENYDGHEGIGDIIERFKDPNNKNKTWGAWAPESKGGGGGAPAGMPNGMSGPSGGARSLVPTDDGFGASLQAKIAEILGGEGAFDRDELLRQLLEK